MQIKLIHKHVARQVPVATQHADLSQQPLDGLTWDKLRLYYINSHIVPGKIMEQQ